MTLDFTHRAEVALRLNGRDLTTVVSPRTTLLDWLRDDIGLTGAKKGCNEGACGTCTVLVDGRRMNGCLTLVVQCAGRSVTTVEGLAAMRGAGAGGTGGGSPPCTEKVGGELHPVQRAFAEHDAFQCGYCTPGQLISAVACIAEGHATDDASVREWMSGNICRCSAYPQITEAVLAAARELAADDRAGR